MSTAAAFTPARTGATARRVVLQLRHDPRTIAMLLVVPCVLIALLAWVYHGDPHVFNSIGGPLLGLFPFIVMFLVTSIATLRERSSGTLERLLAMPLGKLDLLLGYALAFGVLAVIQALVVTAVSVWGLSLRVTGPEWALMLVAVLDAVLGTAVGLAASALANSEFQAVQLMPVVIMPQLLLCGLFQPRDAMPSVLNAISDVLPLSYAVDAMNQVTAYPNLTGGFLRDILVIAAFIVAALILGATTLRRRTP